jgi:hypothetical protein
VPKKPKSTAKAVEYFKELIFMVEQQDAEQLEKLAYLYDAAKRYDRKKSGAQHIPGQIGFLAEDDLMLDGLTRAGEKPPTYNYRRK